MTVHGRDSNLLLTVMAITTGCTDAISSVHKLGLVSPPRCIHSGSLRAPFAIAQTMKSIMWQLYITVSTQYGACTIRLPYQKSSLPILTPFAQALRL